MLNVNKGVVVIVIFYSVTDVCDTLSRMGKQIHVPENLVYKLCMENENKMEGKVNQEIMHNDCT